MQKICVTEKEFKAIREAGGVYVDKTKHISDLFSDDKYFFLTRPRRFGKSLLCSTLAELFSANRALFNGLWIDSSDWVWKKYPVLRFDMSKIASPTATAADVRQGIVNLLSDNAQHIGVADLKEGTPYLMFEQLIKKTKEVHGENVVVLIDEYDKPLLDVINDQSRYRDIQKELCAFYSQLKPAEEDLKFVLITGVFKFTQASIFSGLNNLNDISFDPHAAELLGYTEQEIRAFFPEHLAVLAAKNNISVDAMMLKLQKHYNGYFFGVDVDTGEPFGGVYNPFALNYVFKAQQQLDKWFESGSPAALIKKLTATQFEDLDPENLTVHFSTLVKSCSADDITALSMLYYTGYVTLKKYHNKRVTLGFPNAEVACAFTEALLPLLLHKSSSAVTKIMDKIHDLFEEERLSDLKQLLNDALAPVAYPVLAKPQNDSPQEHLYQIAFYYLFIGSKMPTTLEDMTNRGRIDIVVQLPSVIYVFELKMDEPAAVAIQQIKDKDYSAKFRHMGKQVYAIGISVNSEKRYVKELEWELL